MIRFGSGTLLCIWYQTCLRPIVLWIGVFIAFPHSLHLIFVRVSVSVVGAVCGKDFKMITHNLVRRTLTQFMRSAAPSSRRFVSATKLETKNLQEIALDENCILVDEFDRVLGQSTKRDCHRVGADGDIKLHRAFSVFLFNSHGDMLIQKRASQKVCVPTLSGSVHDAIDSDVNISLSASFSPSVPLSRPFCFADDAHEDYVSRLLHERLLQPSTA